MVYLESVKNVKISSIKILCYAANQFWLPKLVRLDQFWQQNWSKQLILAFFAKIGPARSILGRADFDVTVQCIMGI